LAKHLGISPGELSKRKAKAIAQGLIAEVEWERAMKAARECSVEAADFEVELEEPQGATVGRPF